MSYRFSDLLAQILPRPPKKKKKGFAVMDEETRRKIAAMGGARAHKLKVAHRYTPEEAKAAGKLGGRGRGRPRKIK